MNNRYYSLWDVAVICTEVTMVVTCACKLIDKIDKTTRKTKSKYAITIEQKDPEDKKK